MPVAEDVKTFIQEEAPTVPGWLSENAAYMTALLMGAQQDRGFDSGVYEIGVYAGRYLSLLYKLAEGEPVVGLDTFATIPREDVEANFERLFGSRDRLHLVQGDSASRNARRTLKMLGGRRPRFISVDGDHRAPGVLHDLKVCARLLPEGGIVAIDDFLNVQAIGVCEGTVRFFLQANRRRLAPFCWAGGKLFASRRRERAVWRDVAYTLAAEAPEAPGSAGFTERAAQGSPWVLQKLFGSHIVIF